jgi:predicted TIM-barrel fold metal-dependent hydrolase
MMIQQAVYQGTKRQSLRNKFEKTAMEILSGDWFGSTAEHLCIVTLMSRPSRSSSFFLLDIAATHGVPLIYMEAIPEDMPLPKVKRLESPYNPRFLRANIPAFEKLLAHNRNAKIIWAHVGWCNTGRRTAALCAELLERHSNLYMSFKISRDSMGETRPLKEDFTIKTDWLELIRAYPEQFLIGSDQFYVTPKSNVQVGPPQKEKEGTGRLLALLPPDLGHKVGVENAVRIFKLDR